MTTPTTTTYDALKNLQSDLIRKALEGSIFIAPYTADLPTALTAGSGAGLLPLPPGYSDVGWCDKGDGASWSRSVDTSDVTSWGSAEPTRRDITKQSDGLKFTAQETKRQTIELYEGVDLSTVTPTATTGEITFDRPARPATRYFRVFGLFQDGVGADAIYVAKLLPRANVTDSGDQKWSDGDDPVGYEVTLTANYDETAKTSMRFFFGGPGWRARLADMGFPALS
ncbi:phage tail tube protein [Amycolatopsis sp. NPDC003865]